MLYFMKTVIKTKKKKLAQNYSQLHVSKSLSQSVPTFVINWLFFFLFAVCSFLYRPKKLLQIILSYEDIQIIFWPYLTNLKGFLPRLLRVMKIKPSKYECKLLYCQRFLHVYIIAAFLWDQFILLYFPLWKQMALSFKNKNYEYIRQCP